MKRYLAIFALMILTLLAAAAVGRAAPAPFTIWTQWAP